MKSLMGKAREVSREYVRNLLYVDNHIYKEPDNEEKSTWVRPEVWVSACAKQGVSACLYEVSTAEDRQEVENLLSRADICVMDWKMPVSGTDSSENANSGQETAKDLLCTYISKAKEMPGPRLLCVLTLDDSGARSIIGGLPDCKKDGVAEGSYLMTGSSVKIIVVKRDPGKYKDLVKIFDNDGARPSGNAEIEEGQDDLEDSSSSDDADAAMSEEDGLSNDDANAQVGYLLDYLMLQFAEMHLGIVPTFLLKLLADIRTRTPELMEWFSANLDCAYIIESALAAYPEYASEMLTKAITDAIASSYQYQSGHENLVSELVSNWCDDNGGKLPDKVELDGKRPLSNADCVTWLRCGLVRFCKCQIPDAKKRKEFLRNNSKMVSAAESIATVVYGGKKKVKASCLNYSCRCSQKSMSGYDGNVVRLTAGTVVRAMDGKHYVCIQQGCDSLRLEAGQTRHFFFLPLEETDSQNGAVSTTNGDVKKFLVPSRRAYTLTMVDFMSDVSSSGSAEPRYTDVRAKLEGGKFVFKGKRDGSDEVLQWEFDLKKEIAMKIADDFAHQFSRVAVDGSEWLRLRGKGLTPLESEAPIPVDVEHREDDALVERVG